jgi:UDP-N-acetylmuramate dehydrogenase
MTVTCRDWWTTVRLDEPLASHTTFRIGGPADLLLVTKSEEELVAATRWAREEGVDLLVLGGGSNVLVADGGVRGLVVINRTSALHWPSQGGEAQDGGPHGAGCEADAALREGPRTSCGGLMHAASGVLLSQLVRQAARRGLGRLEWAVGIPGTLGGAIVQNAGAYGSCMAELVRRVMVMDGMGGVRTLTSEALGFGYRTSRFRRRGEEGRDVILSADLALRPRPREELWERMADHMGRRRATQPGYPSAGSVFKNPRGDYAGRLIEAAGLKGARQGDAMVALEHANFIVNVGNARASDVRALIDRVREAVARRFGVELELEIQLVGDWHESCSL